MKPLNPPIVRCDWVRRDHGFSLIEIEVVVAAVGILAAILLPALDKRYRPRW